MGEVIDFTSNAVVNERLKEEVERLKLENASLKQERGVLLSVAELMKVQTREFERQLSSFITVLQSVQTNVAALHQQIPTIRIE